MDRNTLRTWTALPLTRNNSLNEFPFTCVMPLPSILLVGSKYFRDSFLYHAKNNATFNWNKWKISMTCSAGTRRAFPLPPRKSGAGDLTDASTEDILNTCLFTVFNRFTNVSSKAVKWLTIKHKHCFTPCRHNKISCPDDSLCSLEQPKLIKWHFKFPILLRHTCKGHQDFCGALGSGTSTASLRQDTKQMSQPPRPSRTRHGKNGNLQRSEQTLINIFFTWT